MLVGDIESGLFVLRQSPTTCTGDLDGDGVVATTDLEIVIVNWGGPGGDVTGDGTTDVQDLIAVIKAWGEC